MGVGGDTGGADSATQRTQSSRRDSVLYCQRDVHFGGFRCTCSSLHSRTYVRPFIVVDRAGAHPMRERLPSRLTTSNSSWTFYVVLRATRVVQPRFSMRFTQRMRK